MGVLWWIIAIAVVAAIVISIAVGLLGSR